MSRRFGELRQLGYVVRDIEAAMDHWLKVFDVGPWFYVDRLPVGDFRYYGEASDPHVSIAITYSGGAQVELIQQRNDAPSMYRDFIEAGHEGLQHVCYFPENYDEILAKALADGYVVGQGGSSNRGPSSISRPRATQARSSNWPNTTPSAASSSTQSRRCATPGTARTRSAPSGPSVVDLKFLPLFGAGAVRNFKSINHTKFLNRLVSLSNRKFDPRLPLMLRTSDSGH